MAGKRRGGGLRPPDRGTLSSLIRTALDQAGGVREALERGARSGRSRLDNLRADRQRNDALLELGELVLDLIRKGEIDLDELPEARDLVRHLDELDDAPSGGEDAVATPRDRHRFDSRGSASSRRPTPSPRPRDQGDGTVGSARWTPPKPGRAEPVWRPRADEEAEAEAEETDHEPAAKTSGLPKLPTLPKDPHRKGGISFEDDDLEDYMHPDDVPSKDRPDGDS